MKKIKVDNCYSDCYLLKSLNGKKIRNNTISEKDLDLYVKTVLEYDFIQGIKENCNCKEYVYNMSNELENILYYNTIEQNIKIASSEGFGYIFKEINENKEK